MRTAVILNKRQAEACAKYINKELSTPTDGVVVEVPDGFVIDFGSVIEKYPLTITKIKEAVEDFCGGWDARENLELIQCHVCKTKGILRQYPIEFCSLCPGLQLHLEEINGALVNNLNLWRTREQIEEHNDKIRTNNV